MRGEGYGREALALFTGWLFEHAVTELGREWVMHRITRQEWQAR